MGLTDYQPFNVQFDRRNTVVIQFDGNINMGVAMATPKGLLVPVIRDIESKTVMDIRKALRALQEKGEKGTLTLADLNTKGVSLVVSNVGALSKEPTSARALLLPPIPSMVALTGIGISCLFHHC